MMLLLSAITYAQVIWAQIALAILIILGPIFIPFLVFDPLSFLFWGWFRAMITYSLYAVIAGAVLRVFSAVGIAFITSMGSCQPECQQPHGSGLCGCSRSSLSSSPDCWQASKVRGDSPRCSSPEAERAAAA